MSDQEDTTRAGYVRRDILKQIAGVAGTAPALIVGTASTAALAQPQSAPAPSAQPQPAAGYQSLGPDEAGFVEAMVNVMCPADHLTPSGVECGLATYMDRQLSGGFGQGERLYMHGPWHKGKAQLGYQLPLTPEQFFKAGIAAANAACRTRFNKNFFALPADDADGFLKDIAAGKVTDPRVPLGLWFNELVYPLFNQACFADPIYGGNRDKVFWRLIGYPGLPATHGRDMVEYRGKPYPGAKDPKSIADFS